MKQFLTIGILAAAAGLVLYFSAGALVGDHARLSQAPELSFTQATNDGGLAGTPRPAFKLPGLDGQMHAIGQWDGNLILLNFWASWCRPCRKEMPMLNDLFHRYRDQGFTVIGIAVDRPANAQAFIAAHPVDYPILVAGVDGNRLARRYGGGIGLPYSVLIDRDGTIVKTMLGKLHPNRLKRTLKEYL